MMPLPSDAIVDRRRLKRRLTFWRVLAVLGFVVLGVVLVGRPEGVQRLGLLAPGDHVAKISVRELIVGDEWLLETIERAARNDAVRAVVVHVDSPGGTVVGGETVFRNLRALAATKPLVATMGTTATSAGYMISLPAERIFANAGTVTGSIAVVAQVPHVDRLLEKLGIEIAAVRSGRYKNVPAPYEPMTEDGRRQMERLVSHMHALFVEMVVDNRPLTRDEILNLADGRIFTGIEAVENGLVDELGDLDSARAWLTSEHGIAPDLPVIELERRSSYPLVDRLASIVTGIPALPQRFGLEGLLAIWHPDLT